MKQVLWKDGAIASFNSIVEFVSNQWGYKVANDFVFLVDRHIELIKQNPELGIKVANDSSRRLVIHKNVSLFYDVNQDQIELLLFWDNRQDPKGILQMIRG